MGNETAKLALNGATSQLDRWLAALGSGYAPVDGRSFEELLDFAIRFGGLVNFYDLHDRTEGDWVCFFASEPAVVLASIAAFDGAAAETELDTFLRRTRVARDDEKIDRLDQAHHHVFELARRVDLWHRGLVGAPESVPGRLMAAQLHAAIEAGLRESLHSLASFDRGAGDKDALGQALGRNYGDFGAVWNLDRVVADPAPFRGLSPGQRVDHSLRRLESIGEAFLGPMTRWRPRARSLLADRLGEHDQRPQVALYLAFVRLFETAQKTLDTFSRRYRDFYYRDVLRGTLRGPSADSLFLVFTLATDEGVRVGSVPVGTLFSAGQDEQGHEILYAADHGLAVSAARVVRLQALRLVRGRLLGGADGSPRVVRRIFTTEVAVDTASRGAVGWATFGRARAGELPGVEATRPATLGFAFASPYLLLGGGQRRLTMRVEYPAAYQRRVLAPLLVEIAHSSGLGVDEIWRRMLAGAFALYLSTAGGWLAVAKYSVAASPIEGEPCESGVADTAGGNPWFDLEIELPPSAPAVEAFEPGSETDDIPISNPDPQRPTIAALLHQRPLSLGAGPVSVYPISLLDGLPVERIDLRTEVRGLPGLELENTDGTIDSASPFTVFGGLPVVGSYLRIRQRELFAKRLASFELTIQWFALPQNATGFQGYYRDYDLGLSGLPQPGLFDNRSFKARLSVRNPGRWILASGDIGRSDVPPEVYLFRDHNHDAPAGCTEVRPLGAAPLCSATTFDHLEIRAREHLPAYYDPAASALEIRLSEPAYAFGNDLYAQNVLNAVIEDLPDTEWCQEACLTECRPLDAAASQVATCQNNIDGRFGTGGASECLDRCIAGLFQIFLSCLERWEPGREEGTRLRQIQRDLMAALTRSGAERVSGLEQGRCELVQLWNECGNKRWWQCLSILEVMLCIELCGKDPAELDTCLEGCKKQLEEAYAHCVQRCMNRCMRPGKELRYPNDPYLPQAEAVQIDYGAGCVLSFSEPPGGESETECGVLYHLLPFGGYELVEVTGKDTRPPLLPRFSDPGNLYLGLEGLVPPQRLNLLFQMSAARAEEQPPVRWAYLAGNRWNTLAASRILFDSTGGLESSGIVALDLPPYDPDGNTVLSGDLQWLRVSAASEPGAFPQTLTLDPHALSATWVDDGGTGKHLERPLPAHSITSSVQDLADIATIDQPMESFGGCPAETERSFDLRMGERLRHKQRALLPWDYERLVLERFPTVWKVQVLPAHDGLVGGVPGNVLVMTVTGPDSQETLDPTVPRAFSTELVAIRRYLEERSSPFVALHVTNPIYVRIEVRAEVELVGEREFGALADRLNDALVRYLSPWFFDTARSAKGGDYVSESNIAEFIRSRPYVAALRSLELIYEPKPEGLASDWYFLTSAREHLIIPVVAEDCRA